MDVLAESGLGDILLFALVCSVGAILVKAFSVHPFVTSGVSLAAAGGFTWVLGRRARGTWGIWNYSLVFVASVGVLVIVGVGVFLLWVMTCDC